MISRNNTRRFSLLALLLAVALAGSLSFTSGTAGASGASARSVKGTCMPPSVPRPSMPPSAYTVAGWGGDIFGSGILNIPAGLTNVVAIDTGFLHNLALLSDGTVVGWGFSFGAGAETPPAGLTDVTAISAGGLFPASAGFSLALKSDGTVVGWGDNSSGQATPPIFGGCVVPVAISAGGAHSLALLSDGTVVGWGNNTSGQATPPAGLSNVTAISAGAAHSLALLSDGTVVGWGNNSAGQATPPAGLSNVTAISAGSAHSLALKSDGTVVGWGNSFGSGAETPPAGLTNVVAISAGGLHSLALKSDGTVVGWGDNSFCQATAPGCVSNPAAISAGFAHSLAMQTDACVQIGCPVTNNPPTIAAVANTRQQGAPASASTIATVSDPDQSAGSLTVTVNGGASATVNGVTVSGLINTDGTITADIGASCTATNASFTLEVSDSESATATATLTVNVTASTAPVITLKSSIELWPPNHKYHAVMMADMLASATDGCDGNLYANVVIEKVTSDEPDNGTGDGDTANDIVIAAGCKSVQLRAERSGSGNGRVYNVTLRVSDSSGNVTRAIFKVTVPHSNNGSPAVDSGVAQTVNGTCP